MSSQLFRPSHRTAGSPVIIFALAALLALVLPVLSGCSDGGTTPTTQTPLPSTTTSSEKPVVISPESQKWAQQLKDAVTAAAVLAQTLEQGKAPLTDPRNGTVLGLRALGQAVEARKSLAEGDPSTADRAVRDMQGLLARASATSRDETAKAVSEAQKLAMAMSAPSQDSAKAEAALDKIINALTPLVKISGRSTST